MNGVECIKKLSPVLFWDIDKSQADMDKYPSFFVQRVLEYGNWNDWQLLLSYYGKDQIVTSIYEPNPHLPYPFSPDLIQVQFQKR